MMIDREGNETAKSILASKVAPALMSKTITERGTYKASDDGVRGYNEVDVDIPYTDVHVATGAIATFEGEDLPLKSLTASIVPVQSGSGDPSPENERPISGWTEEVVTRCGKNLLPVSIDILKENNTLGTWNGNVYSYRGITYTVELDNDVKVESIIVNGTAEYTSSLVLVNNANTLMSVGETYTLSGCASGGSGTTYYITIAVSPDTSRLAYDTGASATFTYTSALDELTRNGYITVTRGTSLSNAVFKPMLEQDSTATTYEPYAGNTYTIPFTDSQGNPVEVYGGSVDVVNGGEQPYEYEKRILTKDENWTFTYDSSTGIAQISTDSLTERSYYDKLGALNCCSIATYNQRETGDQEVNTCSLRSYARRFYIAVTGFTTLEEWKTYLESNPITLCAKLATPTNFYTQPTSIKSLDGENNIWADTGDVDVEYQTVWIRPTE